MRNFLFACHSWFYFTLASTICYESDCELLFAFLRNCLPEKPAFIKVLHVFTGVPLENSSNLSFHESTVACLLRQIHHLRSLFFKIILSFLLFWTLTSRTLWHLTIKRCKNIRVFYRNYNNFYSRCCSNYLFTSWNYVQTLLYYALY